MKASWACRVVFVLLLATQSAAAGPPEWGVGVLGDSYSDEYQFYPPDRVTARNWVEILATTRGVNFGRFSTTSRGEPRNQGYEYNWARSDATTVDLIRTGQHTGLAGQVARGDVKVVIVTIGGNDFIDSLKSAEPLKALNRTLPAAIANYRTVIETIQTAHPDVGLVLTTLPDIRHLPEFSEPIRDGTIPAEVADAFSLAMRRYNEQIRRTAAGDRRIALVDFDLAARFLNFVAPNSVQIAGIQLDRRQGCDCRGHLFLADRRHPGTLGQGLMALMILETLNAKFGAEIKPISNDELVRFARAVADSSSSSPSTGSRAPESWPARRSNAAR